MILINVKWTIRPDKADRWLDEVAEFTRGTRGEPGNLFFEWSRSVDEENTFVLVEGFRDADAGAQHVQSAHFKRAMEWMPDWVREKPKLIYMDAAGDGWGEMGEVTPR